MSAKMAVMLVEKLVLIAIFFQAIEMKKGFANWSEGGIWAWSRLRVEHSSPFLDRLMNDKLFTQLLTAHAWIAAITFFVPGFSFLTTLLLCFLFGRTLLVSIRFRGSFNGGSDSMTLMTLIALIFATFATRTHTVHVICLWFLALQVCRSFFASGFAKFKSAAWKDGSALRKLTTTSNYGVPDWIRSLLKNDRNSKYAGFAILGFELIFPLGLFNSGLAAVFVAIALLFHLANYFAFGLNRFTFAWLAVYPAYLYCSHAA